MTLSFPQAKQPTIPGPGSIPTNMGELIQAHCETGRRHALRIIGTNARGHVFFDKGRVIHAEFGEDVGLRAVVEMQRAGNLHTQPSTRRWPSHPSLNLDAKTLLAGPAASAHGIPPLDKTGVVRRKQVDCVLPPSAIDSEVRRPFEPEPPPLPETPVAPPQTSSSPAPTPPPVEDTTVVEATLPPTEPPPAPAARPLSILPKFGADDPTAQHDLVPEQHPAGPRPKVATQFKARPARQQRTRGTNAPFSAQSKTRPSSSSDQATTMVRISGKGQLLAARGTQTEALADAAAYIHDMVKLIASDLNRRGHTSIHLRGGGASLIVAKSEIKDVAAAIGPTARLTRLLSKTGLK